MSMKMMSATYLVDNSRRESVLGKLSDLSSRTDTPVKAAKAKEAER